MYLSLSTNEQPFKTNTNWELKNTESCFVHVTFFLVRYSKQWLINNYSPKWRWLAVDIYRTAKRRGKYPSLATSTSVNSCFSIYFNSEIICTTKIDLDAFFACHGCKPGRHFFPSSSEVNSKGYSEFD